MKKHHIAWLVLLLALLLVPSVAAAAKTGDVYSLHVGSYPSAEKAAEQVKALQEKGCEAFSVKPEGKDGRWRVFVGRYAGSAEAAREGARLEQKQTIRFFAVRKIGAQAGPKEPAAAAATAAKAAPAPAKAAPVPEPPKAEIKTGKPLHPQVTITPAAPDPASKRKKPTLFADYVEKRSARAGESVTEGLPAPEHFKFQPFDAGKDAKTAGLSEEEALYAAGVEHYRKGRYSKAIDSFQSYIQQFAGGPRSKACFFWIAECHSQMQDPKKADEAFREALKRWPDDRDVPRETLVSLGFHQFRTGNYDGVVGTFSYYVNIYPDDPFRKEMLYLIARSLTEMQQYEPALKVFSSVIEKYPDTKEATESAIIMANIGVRSPGIKLPEHLAGTVYYRDPAAAYDLVLAKNPPSLEMTERILFQKALGLYQKKLYREAFLASLVQLKRFPNGRCKDAGLANLRAITERLVDEDYQKGDYLRVADTYLTAYEGAWVRTIDPATGRRIAESLRQVGLYREARKVAEHLLATEKDGRSRSALLVLMADVNLRERQYDEAEKIVAELAKQASPLSRDERLALHRIQGDLYLRRGLWAKAASAYAEVPADGAADAAALHRNYGVALRFSDACATALQQFQLAIRQSENNKSDQGRILQDSLAGVGDCYLKSRKYPEAVTAYRQAVESAQSGAQNPWTLYSLGKGYVEMKNLPEANRVFSELKVRTGDDFWNKAIDYTLSDAAWTEKYRKYLPAK